ncbi:nitroreductase family protein [Pontibacter sp. E15-1]|uniref:nitroreductase family protein n=1 Tax=Pontibacter sp. E15-1 TaxID=2919918 RepID=UPI001F4F6C51|nr:nitroreductase family protein [Pontibacter sp. E15-1]MCJ8164474.1 nitroreductase family protein [Pontibacter sp. E15-1]
MTDTKNKIAVHNLITTRRSPRAFREKAVTEEQLESLFQAARWAPSSMNEQPWRFIYAAKEDQEAFSRLFGCLVEGNSWAKNASALFVTVAKKSYDLNGKPNSHAWHDVGLATGNLLLQATELGLHIHLMGGFNAAKAQQDLGIPEGYEPVAMGAIGFAGDPDTLPDPLKERELAPRTRKPLQELVFKGKWQG